jgi:hypothetical protein
MVLHGMHHAAALQMCQVRLTQPQPGPADPVHGAYRAATSAQQLQRRVQGGISCRPCQYHGDAVPIRGYPSGERQLDELCPGQAEVK